MTNTITVDGKEIELSGLATRVQTVYLDAECAADGIMNCFSINGVEFTENVQDAWNALDTAVKAAGFKLECGDELMSERTNDDGQLLGSCWIENCRVPSEPIVNCECGKALGEECEWRGKVSDTVTVEYMPDHLRDSHTAAGNSGTYPANGAIRFRAETSCAARILEFDEEWAQIL
jgi:hypothetical protein